MANVEALLESVRVQVSSYRMVNSDLVAPLVDALDVAMTLLDPQNQPPQWSSEDGWKRFTDAMSMPRKSGGSGDPAGER